MSQPKLVRAVMVSSTFDDLVEERRAVIEAINQTGLHPQVMENSGAQSDADVIETSLQMVRDASALVSLISHRYGQTPVDPKSNPDGLSITELEFNEAMRLKRPILLFIMGEDYAVKPAHIEVDRGKREKLAAFLERAKRMRAGSDVNRIYEVFESKQAFAPAAAVAIGKLAKSLERDFGAQAETIGVEELGEVADALATAEPPQLRALPRYLSSHRFVGRDAELDELDDWCAAADPNPMLLFEAIGGSGKNMVTWTWLNERATRIRSDWAGRIWYSFYEGGATMRAFCQEALAYMTGRPVKDFHKLDPKGDDARTPGAARGAALADSA